MKDKVFKQPIEKKFEFDEAVASVFDDMLSRSVPFYSVCHVGFPFGDTGKNP